jgi:hypothetical protein
MMHRSLGAPISILAVLLTTATACGTGSGGSGGTGSSAGSPPPVADRSPEDLAADAEDPDDVEAAEAAVAARRAATSAPAPAPLAGRQHPRVTATAASPFELDPPDGASANCEREHYRAPAGAKLELRAAQSRSAPGRAIVEVALHNAGTEAVCVTSHIHTHELQSDWLQLQYSDGGKYHHVNRVIALDDARDKSYPVSLLLAPGQTLWTSIDLDQWASRSRNGSEPLPAGSLYAEAIYDTTRETDVWSGRLVSAPFELKIK